MVEGDTMVMDGRGERVVEGEREGEEEWVGEWELEEEEDWVARCVGVARRVRVLEEVMEEEVEGVTGGEAVKPRVGGCVGERDRLAVREGVV